MSAAAPPRVEPSASPLRLPEPLVASLRETLGHGAVLDDPAQMAVFETDGFTLARSRPGAVVFCDSPRQVQQVMKLLAEHDVPIVPRGSGTGLTGGCVAFDNGRHPGVIVSTSRMNRILKIDLENRVAHVVVDSELGKEAFTYALEDGRGDTVHLDAVLEYDEDLD